MRNVLIVSVALKSNILTKTASRRELDDELSSWFGNARDRGHRSRKSIGKSSGMFPAASLSVNQTDEDTHS